MKVFVTGGAGFIGSALVRHLIAEGRHQVLNFDKLTYAGNLASLAGSEGSPNYAFLRGDIGDSEAVSRALGEFRPEAVVNLAAESHVDRSIDGPMDFVMTNVVGTQVLLQSVQRYWEKLHDEERGRFRFLHVSTDEVYGSLGAEGLFTESTAYDPSSPYSASKAASDHLVRVWRRTFGLPTLVTNCSNNYGPFQFPEKLIPLVIIKALKGEAIPIYGDGMQIRDWLHVEDHVKALCTVLAKGSVGDTYNIGGNNQHTNLDVVKAICALMDELTHPHAHGRSSHSELMTFVADRPGHDRRYGIDASKIDRELGWRPQETFETGLRRTVEWYLSNREWWTRILDNTYQGDRLGLLGIATEGTRS